MNTEIIELIKGCKKELVECGLYENSTIITRINAVLQKEYARKQVPLTCCFCNTNKGALIQLYRGWCCVSCLAGLIDNIRKKTHDAEYRPK